MAYALSILVTTAVIALTLGVMWSSVKGELTKMAHALAGQRTAARVPNWTPRPRYRVIQPARFAAPRQRAAA